MNKFLWKPQLIKSLKISAAAFAAIALAGEIGLMYSATAGIITVLSIQNTKRETLKSAGKRWLAFLCALILSKLSFSVLGYNLWAFGVYLFLFALLCLCVGWSEAIAMDSVLITHFLTEQRMDSMMLLNDALLLLIGTGAGILVNAHLHKKEAEFRRLAEKADEQIKGILLRMSQRLTGDDKSEHEEKCFFELQKAISECRDCAIANYGNTVLSRNVYELDYIAMREQQGILLKEIYNNIKSIQYLPEQAEQVAELLEQIGQEFYHENTVEKLLLKQDRLLMKMREQHLPCCREEFEARAVLYYILMQIRRFLEIKREFIIKWK